MNLKIFKISTILLLLTLFALPTISAAQKKPNVIVVITDDQGFNDLGSMGNPYIKTPNIDAFYKESVRFTNYHVSITYALSRAVLMTGRYSNRVNAYHTIMGRSLLSDDEVIFPQIFAQNEVNFTSYIPAGKYDMEAQLIDKNNIVHSAYYVYVEKL